MTTSDLLCAIFATVIGAWLVAAPGNPHGVTRTAKADYRDVPPASCTLPTIDALPLERLPPLRALEA